MLTDTVWRAARYHLVGHIRLAVFETPGLHDFLHKKSEQERERDTHRERQTEREVERDRKIDVYAHTKQ